MADAKTLDVDAFVNGTVAPGVERRSGQREPQAERPQASASTSRPRSMASCSIAPALSAITAERSSRRTRTTRRRRPRRTVILPASAVAPKITKLNKVILVSLKERRIYLYDNRSVVAKYRCAIGMARYPTPTGTFEIRRKVKMPSWTNPGGAWGTGLPKYIKPGPSNPLGTRALYLYRNGRDTGIRFHGTTNRGSIGRAASHGCMRMRREDVEKFYNQVPMYTQVYIVKY